MHLVHHLVGPDRRYATYEARLVLSTLEARGLLDLDTLLTDLERPAEPVEVAVTVQPGDVLGLMFPQGVSGGRIW